MCPSAIIHIILNGNTDFTHLILAIFTSSKYFIEDITVLEVILSVNMFHIYSLKTIH